MISFDKFVKQDSWARIVDLFVAILPLKDLGFKDTPSKEGRPPYSPSDMLKLYIYGYKNHLRSSRKLAHACEINLELIWLLKGLRPCARKIAYFRKNKAKPFKQAFRFFVATLKDMDLIDEETIAIDSFKIRAQNASKNNFNQKKIYRHILYIDQKIEQHQNQLDAEDKQDKSKLLAEKIKCQNTKKDNYKHIEKQLKDSGNTQICFLEDLCPFLP